MSRRATIPVEDRMGEVLTTGKEAVVWCFSPVEYWIITENLLRQPPQIFWEGKDDDNDAVSRQATSL